MAGASAENGKSAASRCDSTISLARLSKPKRDAGDEMVSHWSKANRAVGNGQPVEVHVAKLILDEERQVSGQIEVEATECLISWTVELVFLKVDSTNCGLHMRDCDTDAAAKVRLQTTQEILV